jgi:hypothetical protein
VCAQAGHVNAGRSRDGCRATRCLLQMQRVSTYVVAAAGLCVDVARGGYVHGAPTTAAAGCLVRRAHRAPAREARQVMGG